MVGIRMSEAGIDAVDARAAEEGVKRSEMVRLLLAHGMIHMPKGWRPPAKTETKP